MVWAFGSDEFGQIGDGNRPASECGVPSFTFPCQKVPVQVPGIGNAIGIDAGRGSNVSFAILADYTLRGWGEDDTSGQLGNGLPLKNVSAPVVIKGVSNVVQVSGGADGGSELRTNCRAAKMPGSRCHCLHLSLSYDPRPGHRGWHGRGRRDLCRGR